MPPPAKRENLLYNLLFNIAIPSLLLAQASKPDRLGPVVGLIVALAFPLGYGIWDFAQRKQANFISILGFANVLLTGGLGLMEADLRWFAIKEAAVPTMIGLAVWASMFTSRSPPTAAWVPGSMPAFLQATNLRQYDARK